MGKAFRAYPGGDPRGCVLGHGVAQRSFAREVPHLGLSSASPNAPRRRCAAPLRVSKKFQWGREVFDEEPRSGGRRTPRREKAFKKETKRPLETCGGKTASGPQGSAEKPHR